MKSLMLLIHFIKIILITLLTIISILSNSILTITQSLVKSTKLVNSNNVNFGNIQESNWNKVLQDNKTLSPLSLLNKIKETLELIVENKDINKEYCRYLIDQCSNWIKSDKFITVENEIN